MSERKPFVTYIHDFIGRGRFTLAIKVNEGKVNVGVAFCAPKDRFTRKRGRELSEERVDTDSAYTFGFTRNSTQALKKQAWDMFLHWLKNESTGLVPKWSKRGYPFEY